MIQWLSNEALTAMGQVASEANITDPVTFACANVCDPKAVAYAYEPCDDFLHVDSATASI